MHFTHVAADSCFSLLFCRWYEVMPDCGMNYELYLRTFISIIMKKAYIRPKGELNLIY